MLDVPWRLWDTFHVAISFITLDTDEAFGEINTVSFLREWTGNFRETAVFSKDKVVAHGALLAAACDF